MIGALEDAEDYKAFEAALIADYDAQWPVERELICPASRSTDLRNTGQVLTAVQCRVQHPVVRWMAATLDGMVEARGLAALDTAPEFLLSCEQEVLVERIGWDRDLDPFAAAGDDREDRQLGIGDPHVVLQLRHVFFGSPLFGERPRQHEFRLEHRPSAGMKRSSGARPARLCLPSMHWIVANHEIEDGVSASIADKTCRPIDATIIEPSDHPSTRSTQSSAGMGERSE